MAGEDVGPGDVRFRGALASLERGTRFVELPVQRLSGPDRLNPAAHAGTISVFLLGIVIVTGLYITLFFEFGFAASYDSVAAMEDHAIQRAMRALHRYSSAALVVTTLVHGWKVLTSGRFVGPRRRWRWTSGVAALTLVWLAGVTGYWLVWDRRAAAISEAVAQVLQPTAVGSRFAVRNLLGVSPGSGSGLLLAIWFVHIALTVAIGWFMFRHLRRSKLPWLPPRNWMIVMGVSLAVLSLLVPLGMLGPARPDQLVADMPLDPFVLFLLPPLLSPWRWVALAVMVIAPAAAALLPRLLTRADPAVVVIDEDACTGCELCVVDCPYDALSLAHMGRDRPVAVVEPDQCVACGICVGSCAFDAIELPGAVGAMSGPATEGHGRDVEGTQGDVAFGHVASTDVAFGHVASTDVASGHVASSDTAVGDLGGRDVVVICDRHDASQVSDESAHIASVRCAGMLPPNAIRTFVEQGADKVQVIGCAPSDCRFGTGNILAAERLSGARAPHPPRALAQRIAVDLVDSDRVGWARLHPSEAPASEPVDTRRFAVVGLVVLLSVGAIVAATGAPFRSPGGARVRVAVDHVAAAQLLGFDAAIDRIEAVELIADGQSLGRRSIPHDDLASVGFADWDLPAGPVELQVGTIANDEFTTLTDESFELADREQLLVGITDVPPAPGAAAGRDVFTSRSAGCTVCHSTLEGRDGVGPSLYGVASVAEDRVPGLNAEQYVRQSILLPDQYVVDGWPPGQMLPIYRERLSEQQLESLIAYLLTLTEAAG